jgi:hypothetical protein
MSAKPTPGPYRIERIMDGGYCIGFAVMTRKTHTCVGSFWKQTTLKQVEANARAWVDGAAAMETLERIRATIISTTGNTEEILGNVCKILNEAKL